jgi:transposase
MSKSKYIRKTKHLLKQTIHCNAAGIDIGAEEVVVAIPLDRDEEQPVRTYESFTPDLRELRDWLIGHQIQTVAMESTGVYWIPLYDLLEASGIEVCLVNARHVKGVPGKKTDVCDAQWLQQLHAAGLLKSSFRPRCEIVQVRQLMRHRSNLIRESSRHIQHMQKALTEMNLQIHHVFSDLDGKSAMLIIESILNGNRNVDKLWDLRDSRVKAPKEKFQKAMEGNYQDAQLFILKQCHEAWVYTQDCIMACGVEIESTLNENIPEEGKLKQMPVISGQRKRKHKNSLGFNVYQMSYQYYGVDLSGVDGVSSGLLSILMSEIGEREDFLKNFKSAKHFCSWLGLCPDQRISGGKVLSSKTRRVVNRVTEAFRMGAFGVTNAHCRMGEYARRMKSRLGKVEGTTAVAHKIARLVYTLIKTRIPYDEEKAFKPNSYSRSKRLSMLKKMAKSLDLTIDVKSLEPMNSDLVI